MATPLPPPSFPSVAPWVAFVAARLRRFPFPPHLSLPPYIYLFKKQYQMNIRVGMGYDVHKLVPGRALWLGGIKIDHTLGLLGHSDADVLIHAICDALLGAANMRDIGYHFPDTSADTLDMDSKIILRQTIDLLATKGYRLGISMPPSALSVLR